MAGLEFEEIREALNSQEFSPSQLAILGNIVTERRKVSRANDKAVAKREVASTARPGDAFTLTGLRPQYLNGTRVEYVRACGGYRVEVRIADESVDPRAAARWGDFPVKVPANCLIPAE